MNEALSLILSLVAGVFLGTIFFGGLWLTVRKGLASKLTALWFLGSQVLRVGIVLTGFYFVSDSHWERLIACLLGFIAARFVVTGLIQDRTETLVRLPTGCKL